MPSFRADAADRGLETRIEALYQELAGLIDNLRTTTQRLENVAEELRARRQTDKVVVLDRGSHRQRRHDPDILTDFLE
jgi:ABC-type transporter Mla subunit MlaD